MIAEVTSRVQDLAGNTQKQKMEEMKLQRELQEIETKQKLIQDLRDQLAAKDDELE